MTIASPVAATSRDSHLSWADLPVFQADQRVLDRNRIFSASRKDPMVGAIDMLRTRLRQALTTRGWSRVGITSATKGCGKTFLSCNLGFSFARDRVFRTLLVDLDLRNPSVAKTLGIKDPGRFAAILEQAVSPLDGIKRVGHGLAVMANATPLKTPAETMQDPRLIAALDTVFETLSPNLVLYDLPPILVCDDVLAFQDQLDGLLVVARGGLTTAREIREIERLIEDRLPLIGVVLNEAEDGRAERYAGYY
jgi:tyrosine-protein kinase Etk/Wzc